MERQPSYLESDSPAAVGCQFLLNADSRVFTIPAPQLTSKMIKNIPKSPRSEKLQGLFRRKEMMQQQAADQERREHVMTLTRMRAIDNSRRAFAETMRHPKSTTEPRLIFEQPAKSSSIADTARQFLSCCNDKPAMAETTAARSLNEKLRRLRQSVEAGDRSLQDLAHRSPVGPRSSRSTHGSPRKRRAAAAAAAAAAAGGAGEEGGEGAPESAPLNRLRVLLSAAVADSYARKLHSQYTLRKSLLPYVDDDGSIRLIVRLQRWVRHKRLQKTFWTLLRHRRIVIKSLQRYALRFQHRYKHHCATVILDFFKTCFDEAGFRMAMKIFLFRVVRTQRVIRDFLHCNRSRRELLRRRLNQLIEGDQWSASSARRQRTAAYVANHAPDLLYDLVRKYRKPYIRSRFIYMRSWRAGDLTPAFQELDPETCKSYLQVQQSDRPPQYADGQLTRPTFRMLTHPSFLTDLNALLDSHEKKANRHYRATQAAAAAQAAQAEFDEAVRRGEGHLYQLAQLHKRQELEAQQVTPKQELEEVLGELRSYEFRKKLMVQERENFDKEQAKQERMDNAKLSELYRDMERKMM